MRAEWFVGVGVERELWRVRASSKQCGQRAKERWPTKCYL